MSGLKWPPEPVESFLGKFLHLWTNGEECSLTLSTKDGTAWVKIEVNLGYIETSALVQIEHSQQTRRTPNGPSHQRRRAVPLHSLRGLLNIFCWKLRKGGIWKSYCLQVTELRGCSIWKRWDKQLHTQQLPSSGTGPRLTPGNKDTHAGHTFLVTANVHEIQLAEKTNNSLQRPWMTRPCRNCKL